MSSEAESCFKNSIFGGIFTNSQPTQLLVTNSTKWISLLNDDASKLFFNDVVGSWDESKATAFDQQRETLAGLNSYETFSLEGPVSTFRLIAKACKFEHFLLFGEILRFGVLDATVDPNAATLLDLVERDGSLHWEIVQDHFIEH